MSIVSKEEVLPREPSLIVDNLTKKYADNIVLDQLSLTVNPGEIHGILGRNGIGKTTLIECVVGLRPFNQGTIKVRGLDILSSRDEIIKQVGIQPQEANLFPRLSIEETMQLFSSFYGDPLAYSEIMNVLDLERTKNKRVKSLSTGQKQRLLVALSLIGNPSFIILDEPTTGIDPQVKQLIWKVLQKEKTDHNAILLSTHNMEEAEKICDRVSILHNKKIVASGMPKEIIMNNRKTMNDTLEDVFLHLTGSSLRGEID
ncbi:ABC transporter ATP-binding protein [Oceanobacillus picturae]|uniref:ABC transporter ATP-binding protein n=1 Tax=Oceanobacillus picturae TaxID=171693 RepID=UPI000E6796BE|nr:ABC transporter ATP-binding protein [Oceanobacillus picturae]RIU90166.1 ABC transporter ATP-binding protein [Oceanobacillus picturae]